MLLHNPQQQSVSRLAHAAEAPPVTPKRPKRTSGPDFPRFFRLTCPAGQVTIPGDKWSVFHGGGAMEVLMPIRTTCQLKWLQETQAMEQTGFVTPATGNPQSGRRPKPKSTHAETQGRREEEDRACFILCAAKAQHLVSLASVLATAKYANHAKERGHGDSFRVFGVFRGSISLRSGRRPHRVAASLRETNLFFDKGGTPATRGFALTSILRTDPFTPVEHPTPLPLGPRDARPEAEPTHAETQGRRDAEKSKIEPVSYSVLQRRRGLMRTEGTSGASYVGPYNHC
jgi:hypothetical protein